MEREINIPGSHPGERALSALPKDLQFYLALALGLLVVWMLSLLASPAPQPGWEKGWRYLQLLLLYPVLEEVLFRGLLQGALIKRISGGLGAVSHANLVTSLIFATAHLYSHPLAWAAATFAPSLLFGYFRDRYRHVLPAILLHVFYNSAFFLAPVMFG
jgi:membrane protease YdiL (CAAX protease family)